MKKFSQIALVGALAFAFAGAAMAQGAGGGGGSKTDVSKPPVSPKEPKPHLPHRHKKAASDAGGTTLHQQDKASHLKGASAAAAASAMGTNDKGAPQ
ncbi:hypothetical protein AWB64_03702 [Caballeronia sordidicola]|uniref:TolA protein n=1 Tax=Caballeronia sordidicola TaxID=196367 RepID=A0A158GY36_CABSO|nr:hypothetical protein [Caballeronia sordidicola]SAL36509.1 hypothetical protein AWB64_03702 [Caballeronia sordidicola]